MLERLDLKQKIIGGIAVVILVIGITTFFLLQQEENSIDFDQLVEVNEQENKEENTNENQESQEKMAKEKKIKITVHITGEINKKGILVLEEGARIADAIKAAGGETKQADLDEVNLAYELQDGQKIYIPNKKDKKINEEKTYITSESGNNVIKEQNSSTKGANKKVNINTANQSELETLPGIGASIASRIIEYRQQNGKFQKIEDLQNVKGIGDSKYTNIKEYVTVK